MLDKFKNNEMVGSFAVNAQQWTKVRMDNIVFPDLRVCRLLNAILAQVVKTKEQPQGCLYSSDDFRVVLRLLDGKVYLEEGGLPDTYSWKHSKVEKASAVKAIGYKTEEAKANTAELLRTLSKGDQQILDELFQFVNGEFLLVTTPEEKRQIIEITQELYDAGLTAVVDEWMEPDEQGMAQETILEVGDFIVCSPDGGFYTIRRKEFLATHKQCEGK